MGISWSYRQAGEDEEEFPFNFLNRIPARGANGSYLPGRGSDLRSGGARGRSSGEAWRDLLRMSGDDNLERTTTDMNRRSAESDYDDGQDESIAAILSSLIRR